MNRDRIEILCFIYLQPNIPHAVHNCITANLNDMHEPSCHIAEFLMKR
jgi:hypothetical protein